MDFFLQHKETILVGRMLSYYPCHFSFVDLLGVLKSWSAESYISISETVA
jgi:hypothetical protein